MLIRSAGSSWMMLGRSDTRRASVGAFGQRSSRLSPFPWQAMWVARGHRAPRTPGAELRSCTFVRRLRGVVVLPTVLTLGACGAMPPPACPIGQEAAVHELLYFGTDRSSGTVTPDDWAKFLSETVTPRFPGGLTVWQAAGQWRSPSGTPIGERSYVLSLVHPPDAGAEKAVLELITSYKTAFDQEAVLRVKAFTCISF